jgi:hypothetical protein
MNVIDTGFAAGDKTRKDIMPAFTIDAENNITFFASMKAIDRSAEGKDTFSNLEELTALADKWPGARLVEIWNSLPGVQPVERFTNRQVAVARIWKAIQHLQPIDGAHARPVRSKNRTRKESATRVGGPAAREHSKTAKITALMRQPKGATLKALMRATGWQAHSVRGFISGQLGKKMGLSVGSFERDGERVYILKG